MVTQKYAGNMAKREAALAHPALRGTHTSMYIRILTLRVLISNYLPFHRFAAKIGGEGGIRTPGPLRVNGFQDRRLKPLGHLSGVR